jgi:hypothetical protein
MLEKITSYSIRNRLIVVAGAFMILLTGSYIVSRMDIDIFPELSAPTVVIMTEAHGMAPEEVERLFPFPLRPQITEPLYPKDTIKLHNGLFHSLGLNFNWGMIIQSKADVSERQSMCKINSP